MQSRIKSTLLAAAGLTIALPAFAQQMIMPGSNPADQAFSAEMGQMSTSMSGTPMSANTDHDFVTMMLPHHEGAVAMAKTELRYGKDPMLRKMAQDIIASQDQEILQMKTWQAAHPAK